LPINGEIMKYAIALLAIVSGVAFAGDVYVQPHVNRNGTYVQGYHRTTPDSNPYNNYSTQGNVNPYTGQAGTVNPYQQPSYQQPQPVYQGGNNRAMSGTCLYGQNC
jgi:hypothetical protein